MKRIVISPISLLKNYQVVWNASVFLIAIKDQQSLISKCLTTLATVSVKNQWSKFKVGLKNTVSHHARRTNTSINRTLLVWKIVHLHILFVLKPFMKLAIIHVKKRKIFIIPTMGNVRTNVRNLIHNNMMVVISNLAYIPVQTLHTTISDKMILV